MSKANIVIEITPEFSENRKWVSVSQLKDGDKRGAFRYFEAELPKRIIESGLDWFYDDEIVKEIFLNTLEELYYLLDAKNLDPAKFDVPWKVDYPYNK